MKKPNTESGVSLLEIMVCVAILTIIFAFFFDVVLQTNEFSSNLQSDIALQKKVDVILYGIRDDLLLAKKIFERGSEYRNRLEFSSHAPLKDASDNDITVMPDIGGPDDGEGFGVDGMTESVNGETVTYSSKTGNFLLMVKKVDTALCNVDADPEADYRIDLYRMVAYYPTALSDNTFGSGYISQMVRWESKLFADYKQIERIPNVDPDYDRKKVLTLLWALKKVNYLADFTKGVNGAFYEINVDTASVPPVATGYSADSAYVVEQEKSEILAHMSSGYSLGLNEVQSTPRASKYSVASGRFPGGFEVQIMMISNYTTLLRVTLLRHVMPKGHVMARTGELIVRSSVY